MIGLMRKVLSTCFGIGYIPGPGGTYGSLLTVILLYLFIDKTAAWFVGESVAVFLLFYLIFVFVSFWLCNDTVRNFGKDDPKSVCIDEVAGQLITFLFVPLSGGTLLAGFVIFRFFDIVKPYPIHLFEELEDGVGIVSDDVVAGLMSCVLLNLLVVIYGIIVARI